MPLTEMEDPSGAKFQGEDGMCGCGPLVLPCEASIAGLTQALTQHLSPLVGGSHTCHPAVSNT